MQEFPRRFTELSALEISRFQFDELTIDIVREALTGVKPESYDSELQSAVRPPNAVQDVLTEDSSRQSRRAGP